MKINTIEKIFRIMKLTVFLMLLTLLQVSAESLAQVTLVEKDASLEKIFREIERQSDYVFFYNRSLRDIAIDVEIHNTPIDQALDKCFEGLPLTYKIVDKTIVIIHMGDIPVRSRAKAGDAPIQARDVQGKVTDSLGNPLAGATVKVKNKNQVTTTDINGEFILKDVDEGATLVISYVGFEIQEITSLGDRADLHITLKPLVSSIGEIEINTGYQRIKPEQSTGSIAVIRTKEYESRINTTDFLTGLQNKIPGLLINNDIQFEGNGLFQIRGISTINGNRTPLIVVDGYPTELTLDMIDPNEIESVTVLKDAAAATVYGARSSNGVIIIERKKGKVGKMVVNARATTSYRPKENYDRYRWDDNGSSIAVDYEKLRNMTAGPGIWAMQKTASGAYSRLSQPALVMAHWHSDTDPISIEERDRQLAAIASHNNTKDYGRLFLRAATAQTYNLNISGGSERVLYYLTANYTRNNTTQVGNDNNIFRLSGRSNMTLSDRLSLEIITDLQQARTNTVPVPEITDIFPFERFQDEDGNPMPIYIFPAFGGNVYYNDYIKSLGLLDNLYYPVADLNEVRDEGRTLTSRVTANLRYNIGNGFSLSLGGVHENALAESRHLATENSTEVRQYINYYTKSGPNGLIYNVPKGSFLKQQNSTTRSFTVRAQANYDKRIGQDHSLNFILGAEVRKGVDRSNLASYFGYNDQTLFQQPIDFKMLNTFSASYANLNPRLVYTNLFNQQYTDDRFISGYTNAVYAYKDKYSLTGSIRVDQSNLFGTDPKYKYKPLWSVGAAWNLHKEDFMQQASWVKSLRLRVAHGFNGNVAKNALPQVIATDRLNNLNASVPFPSLVLSSYANSGLRWEQSRNFNVGVNYSIFNGISGSIDYYIKTSTDILANNQIDASKGAVSALINQASIENKGLEINLRADWITRRNFNWNTGFVFAHNSNKVLEVYNSNITSSSYPWTYMQGSHSSYLKDYAVGALFNYRYAGISNTGNTLIYAEDGRPVLANSDEAAVEAQVDYAGSSIPVINMGLSNRVDIGSFYAYCMINYFGKFALRVPMPDPNATRPLEGAGNYWKQPGDEMNPDVLPAIADVGSQDYFNTPFTDKYTVNGAYLTLGDITAAYSFRNSKFVKRMGIPNLEIKVQASNVYTVALNSYNYSIATGDYAKPYLTPTYSAALSINF